MNPMKYVYALLVSAVLGAAGWGGYALYQGGGSSAKLDTATAVAEQAVVAASTTQKLQANVNQANAQVRKAEAGSSSAAQRLRALEQRMLDLAAAKRDTNASAEALRDYAADLDRDMADCRKEYAALGGVAAGAAIAAHGLDQAWPGQAEWALAQEAFVKQTQDLLK